LGKPLTKEGQTVQPLLEFITPSFNLPQAPSLEQSQYIHQLYKLCLNTAESAWSKVTELFG